MPIIEILLSLFHPNPSYLRELLLSLNEQTYPSLRLLVRCDDPAEVFPKDIFSQCITNFPVIVLPSTVHVGYTKSFELLTAAATGDYVCYCDQDDIWLKEKISTCYEETQKTHTIFACCDLSLIDEKGEVFVSSLRAKDPLPCRIWCTGDDITLKSLFSCYTPGLTLLAKRKAAQDCLPFSPSLGHDHWLGSCLSAMGPGANIGKPLVFWRRHGGNVSGGGIFQDVNGKGDYKKKWVAPTEQFIEDFSNKFPDYPGLEYAKAFNQARAKGHVFTILRYRAFSPRAAWGEVIMALLPTPIFKIFLYFQGAHS